VTHVDDFSVVPGSELVISRRAYRDNKSDYLIDGNRSTHKEVTALLRKRGIDLDNNRFLILQVRPGTISCCLPLAREKYVHGGIFLSPSNP
jgi:structural maintenance of chromosome 4